MALGPAFPIVCVFPQESMRAEAARAVDVVATVAPLIEAFMGTTFTTPSIRIWYGFVIGNSGGGGAIYSEDRTTYETRTGPTRLPFDSILGHEVGHSYIGHESLNQFLELYAYNLARGAGVDPSTWSFTRNWSPNASSNAGIAALLDIYQLVGFDVMQRAYRTIYPLSPPYGQTLSQPVMQAFLSQVPPSQQAAVAQKLAAVGF